MTTKIEWVARPGTIPESWNPVTGCSRVSEGCRNCYAERMARRLAGRCGYPEAPNHFNVTAHADKLYLPYRWRKPRTVFVVSMGDIFHESVTWPDLERIFKVMVDSKNHRHTFLLLTKRAHRMQEFISTNFPGLDQCSPHIWLGVTAENQTMADERIPLLLQTPTAVWFVSCEPLLESIDLNLYLPNNVYERDMPLMSYRKPGPRLDWILVGGESGPNARPTHPGWVQSIHNQCQAAGIPFFFKQRGEFVEVNENFKGNDTVLLHNGRILGRYDVWADRVAEKGYAVVRRVGKKRAGHLLNGQVWHQWPA